MPEQNVRKNEPSVPKNMLARVLPNSFKFGAMIFQRTQTSGKKDGKRGSKLMYVLKPGVHLEADMPLTCDFDPMMGEELECAFSHRMEEMIRTALRL